MEFPDRRRRLKNPENCSGTVVRYEGFKATSEKENLMLSNGICAELVNGAE